ncbi:hypothetical protein Q7P35_004655 [Cladosporium inversicolor]
MFSTLLDLPRELRDEIYDCLSSASTVSGDPLLLATLPSGARRHNQGLHSVLRVNRMLREDALDRLRDCNTYLVSQRYRAFVGFHNMTLFQSASIPPHAQRLYLRIYIAVPERVAKPITQAAQAASMMSQRSGTRGKSWTNDFPKVFTVLTSELRTCFDLKDLVLEIVTKRQDSQFGTGCESTERSEWISSELVDICNAEMEEVVRELPAIQRYTILGGGEAKFVRRRPGQPWTRQCLIPQCVDKCHCYEAFGKTCIEDAMDLQTDLTPTAREEWLSVMRDQGGPDLEFEPDAMIVA